MKISAQVVADSLSPYGDRLLSVLVTFPRFILAELNTHRMLSKNSASSRAIPLRKMINSIQQNPFIPIGWQKDHKGMQGVEYFTEEESIHNRLMWLDIIDSVIGEVEQLHQRGITKQLCNRLLEPFMWHTVLITGNVNNEGWLNFFNLRCPQYELVEGDKTTYFKSRKDLMKYFEENDAESYEEASTYNEIDWLQINKGQAEIHMMALAEAIWNAMNESAPKQLKAGEWHIPFENKIMEMQDWHKYTGLKVSNTKIQNEIENDLKIKLSTAMAARTSYTIVGDEKEVSYERLLAIHDKMAEANPFHASPFEHCAKVMSDEEYEMFIKGKAEWEEAGGGFSSLHVGRETKGWCRNYRGFIQYRHLIENK